MRVQANNADYILIISHLYGESTVTGEFPSQRALPRDIMTYFLIYCPFVAIGLLLIPLPKGQ